MEKIITVIRGDGIGPEIVDQAVRILDRIGEKFGHTFHYQDVLAGGCAIDAYGTSLPQETLEKCLNCDSVLLGAVGGPKWDGVAKEIRPEAALLGIRAALGLYANLRPARLFPQLAGASPLKPEIAGKGIDLMMVRELTGGAYFGAHVTAEENGELTAHDLPAEWNRLYKAYLGVDVPNDREGILQDSHWANGNIGYFPSYALGSAYGAHMLHVMRQTVDVDAALARGDLSPVNGWLCEHIWQYGGLYEPETLLSRALGEPFDPMYYVNYLKNKYSKIYGLAWAFGQKPRRSRFFHRI